MPDFFAVLLPLADHALSCTGARSDAWPGQAEQGVLPPQAWQVVVLLFLIP